METSRLVFLLEQYANKTIESNDLESLRSWFYSASPEDFGDVLNQCKNLPHEFRELLKAPEDFITRMESKLDKAQGKLITYPAVHRIHFLKTAWFKYASVIIIVSGIGAYLWNAKETSLKNTAVATIKADVAAPDRQLAIITLSNGKTVTLDSLSNGLFAQEGKVQIKKLADGRIVYNGISSGEIMYNTISVPRGSRIASLTLSDGTVVYLNSSSSLRYPVAFNNDERNVEITGEAYFEVAKNAKRKFSVTGNGITTQVLGTRFNMNTYKDEEFNKITLLDGSIKVIKSNESVIVKPGDQAIIYNGKIKINQSVDLTKVMAWKEGIFNFQEMNFSAVMRQISRWYDVDVIYPKGVPLVELGGEIQKTLSLSEMLDALSALGVKYEITGKTLTILP
jgi:transmembrane sensor